MRGVNGLALAVDHCVVPLLVNVGNTRTVDAVDNTAADADC